MGGSLETLIRDWDGLGVLSRFDAATASWIFIALHDDTLGSAVGGTRVQRYARPADGLLDALRLAEGMTHKWAALELDSGGGKAVLALSRELSPAEREGLLLRYGALVESLRGTFSTGRDLGTSDEDMLILSRVTSHVHGVDRERGSVRDPGPFTAAGVLAAMRAVLRHCFADADFRGRRILIQGTGAVGAPLARRLAAAGAVLQLADVEQARAEQLAAELGATALPAEQAHARPCDLYAPCAVGQTLNRTSIPQLQCRAVVGSANNQLADPRDAGRLHERGILYAPDFIANGGGALAFGLIHRGLTDEREIARRLDGIGEALAALLVEADARGESPLTTAQRRVARRLQERRAARA